EEAFIRAMKRKKKKRARAWYVIGVSTIKFNLCHREDVSAVWLLTPEGPTTDAEEEAFIRAMKRKKKKRARAWYVIGVSTIKFNLCH
ncbi:hypothetical protein E7X19_26615, partial [Bacteroides fragilis]